MSVLKKEKTQQKWLIVCRCFSMYSIFDCNTEIISLLIDCQKLTERSFIFFHILMFFLRFGSVSMKTPASPLDNEDTDKSTLEKDISVWTQSSYQKIVYQL